MNIKCEYYNNAPTIYACRVKNQQVLPGTKLEFIGEHHDGKTDNDVKFIKFQSCIISKVPQGLTEIFQNLEGLHIYNSGLKDINRNDLIEYKNFKWFYFTRNEIEYLHDDLFADCKKLTKITFEGNPLTTVEPNILDGLVNLIHVDLNGKKINYGIIDSKSTISLDDPKLLEIKEKLYKEYKTANSKVIKENEKLRKDVEELTKLKSFYHTDEALKDFRINIGGKQFLVHKTFLAARSPTLAEILRNNPRAENLNLLDISVDIFEHILKFLYKDELPKKVDFLQFFAAAGRLKIEDLKEYAAKKIIEQLDDENAPEVLSLGSKYNHDEMKQKAFGKIKQNHPKIEIKEEWLNKGVKIEKVVEHLQKIRKIEKDLANSLVD